MSSSDLGERVDAVIVDYHAGQNLADCIDSLVKNSVTSIVVVNNAAKGASSPVLAARDVVLVEPEVNLGYGRGVNRGAAATSGKDILIVSNPDVIVHDGAIEHLIKTLDDDPEVGIVGPLILNTSGERYPSTRVFPDPFLAGLHALLAPLWADNPFTKKYRSPGNDANVDWVSGAFFAIRRELFERIGGFDEGYFMFAEDMDLCWRAHRAGARIAFDEEAVITHVEGVSRRRAPRSMIVAHHVSAMRFFWRTSSTPRRLLAPVAALLLGARLAGVLIKGAIVRPRTTA